MQDPREAPALKIIAAYMDHQIVPRHRLEALVHEVCRALSLEAQARPAGTSILSLMRLDAEAVAVECLDHVRHSAETRGLGLSLTVAPGTPREVTANPVWLRKVIQQLLENAVELTAKGAIELRLQPCDTSGLRIQITDTGRALSSAQLRRLFESLLRLDRSVLIKAEVPQVRTTRSANLLELNGGRIGHSDHPGGGNVFWLDLPLDEAQRPAIESMSEPSDARLASSQRRTLKLLVVDDDLIGREFASAALESAGHQVTCVDGGGLAIAAVEEKSFDLVLMDIRMPLMDGVEERENSLATRRIRALEGPRGSVPILAVTAQTSAQHLNRCRRAGMNGHLLKPYFPEVLNATVLRAAAS